MPEQVIRRRFWSSLVNFDRIYRPIATSWRLYDGSVLGGRPLIASGRQGGALSVRDQEKWQAVRTQIEEAA